MPAERALTLAVISAVPPLRSVPEPTARQPLPVVLAPVCVPTEPRVVEPPSPVFEVGVTEEAVVLGVLVESPSAPAAARPTDATPRRSRWGKFMSLPFSAILCPRWGRTAGRA